MKADKPEGWQSQHQACGLWLAVAVLYLGGCRAAQRSTGRQGEVSNRSQDYKITPVLLEVEDFAQKRTVQLGSFS